MPFLQQFQQINDYASKKIAPLNKHQLNWKLSSGTWSVAQCLDHLIVNNVKYFKTFEEIANNRYHSTTWQRISPFTNFLEKKLLEFTAPVARKKAKAPSSFSPSKSFIDKNIVQRFLQQQEKLMQYYDQLEPIANSQKIIVSSPFSSLITFRLNTVLTALADHEQRHINQADIILNNPRFPKE